MATRNGIDNLGMDDPAEALWDEARLDTPELRDLPDWVDIHPNKRVVLGILLKRAASADAVMASFEAVA